MRRTLLLLLLVALPVAARGGIAADDPIVRQGDTTSLAVTRADGSPAAGAAVTATFRPGSTIPHERSLGTADEAGHLDWTPASAGLVTLSASIPAAGDLPEETASVNLPVRHSETPVGGVIIMIVAGIILYGGVFRGFRNLG